MYTSFDCPHCGEHTEVSEEHLGQSGPCISCGKQISVPGPMLINDSTLPQPAKPQSARVVLTSTMLGYMFFGCVCSGILVALLLPARRTSREAARRSSCNNNLKQIGLATHNHHDTFGRLPGSVYSDNGTGITSWRTLILPFMEQEALYERYDQESAWDAQKHAPLLDEEIDDLTCPSTVELEAGDATYRVISAHKQLRLQPAFTRGKAIDFRYLTDGTSNTILSTEGATRVKWVAVTDFNFQTLPVKVSFDEESTGISSMHPVGAQVLMADASVRFIPDTIEQSTLRKLIARNDGELPALP